MSVSVRMHPLLEIELEQAARRRGVTKSQFIIAAVERALGRKNPHELMLVLQAEEPCSRYPRDARAEVPYETDVSRAKLTSRLRAKHGGGGAG